MSAARTFHLLTLGCKVNQYESQALREAWAGLGLDEVADPAGAEVVVVNSCAVTAGALADLRQLAARVRRQAPAARLIVTGCAAQAVRAEVEAIPGVDCIAPQADKETLLAGLPGLETPATAGSLPAAAAKAAAPAQSPDAAAEERDSRQAARPESPPAASGKASARSSATGSAAREIKIAVEGLAGPIPPGEEAEETWATPTSPPPTDPILGSPSQDVSPLLPQRSKPGSEHEPSSPRTAGRAADHRAAAPPLPGIHSARSKHRTYPAFAVSASPRARAQVKVQDGCSHGCAYCIVPLARGPAVSREPEEALAECRRLLAGGWRELVLTGINLRQYRSGKRNFWGLLRYLEERLAPEWTGRARVRLSSLDPGQLGAEALDTLAASRLACPHLHLSLQAGSPAVLRRMGRGHYGPQEVLDFLERLRAVWPRFGLGADLLVGFPGESPEEFAETRRFVAALPLTYAHVFPFSPRPGTPAATRPSQVAQAEKKVRAAALRRLAGARRQGFLKNLASLPGLTMVLEDAASGRGMCEYGVDCRLAAVPAEFKARRLVRVRLAGVEKDGLLVEPVPGEP